MAFSVSTNAIGRGLGFVVYHGSWSGNTNGCGLNGDFDFDSTIGDTLSEGLWGTDGSFSSDPISCPKDTVVTWRANGYSECLDQLKHGGYSNDKTFADDASFPLGLTPGTPTAISCAVSGSVIPNTVQSTGTVTLEYRVKGTGTWLLAGTVASGISGSGSTALAGSLYGLSPGTTYEARYHLNRTTVNAPDFYSPVGTFTTQASAAVVIGPPVSVLNLNMPTPSLVTGAGAIIIIAVDQLSLGNPPPYVHFDLLIPTISVDITRSIARNVLMSDEITRTFRMS